MRDADVAAIEANTYVNGGVSSTQTTDYFTSGTQTSSTTTVIGGVVTGSATSALQALVAPLDSTAQLTISLAAAAVETANPSSSASTSLLDDIAAGVAAGSNGLSDILNGIGDAIVSGSSSLADVVGSFFGPSSATYTHLTSQLDAHQSFVYSNAYATAIDNGDTPSQASDVAHQADIDDQYGSTRAGGSFVQAGFIDVLG